MSLRLQNIIKKFDKITVLDGVTLDIEAGEFLVLLGASGCGKSTLLNCIAGLEPVTDGKIFIDGLDSTHTEPAHRDIAMVFQSYALYPSMNVARNITFSLECAGVSKKDRKTALHKVAHMLQIDHLLGRKPGQLSGGQRQRVAIGRALVRSPKIFLLDEPMSNLDAKLRNEMRSELRKLHQKLQATFILVTHDQIEAMSMATKIAIFDKGIIQQFGTPDQLYHKPNNIFVADFIGNPKINLITGRLSVQNTRILFNLGDLKIPLDAYDFITPPTQGQQVILGVRPENIYRDINRLQGKNFQQVSLPVKNLELTGADINVQFHIENQCLMCRFLSTRSPDIGSVQTLYIDSTNCSVFDAHTKNRL